MDKDARLTDDHKWPVHERLGGLQDAVDSIEFGVGLHGNVGAVLGPPSGLGHSNGRLASDKALARNPQE